MFGQLVWFGWLVGCFQRHVLLHRRGSRPGCSGSAAGSLGFLAGLGPAIFTAGSGNPERQERRSRKKRRPWSTLLKPEVNWPSEKLGFDVFGDISMGFSMGFWYFHGFLGC